MKKSILSIYILLIAVIIASLLSGCDNGNGVAPPITAVVQRGDLEVRAGVDGYIETPGSINLYFDASMFGAPYSSRIRKIYVEKGQMVKAGALLAKLDDTSQKLSVEAAQYALELAINNMVQTVCCGIKVSPSHYTEAVPLKRYEFAMKEMEKAQSYLLDGRYEESAEQVTLARLDMEGARDYFNDPAYKRVKPSINAANDVNDINQQITTERYIDDIIARLTADIEKVVGLQKQYTAGDYGGAKEAIQYLLMGMSDTRTLINSVSHLPGGIEVPDTCTAYTMLNEISASLDRLEVLAQTKDIDAVKYAETLNLARHDIELGKKIIDENRETYWLGLNLKVMRDTNIGIQTALVNLERAKQALLKTELIAPFDGRVEDINLRAGDMITQRYSTTGAPIDSWVIRLADTSYFRLTGTVDEIDAVKIRAGQKAKVFVDAAPGRQFDGTVKFISNYGPQQVTAGVPYYGTIQPTVPTYKIEIDIDKAQTAGLYNGLSASAEILIDSRPNVLIIPNGALSGKNLDYTVRVLTDDKAGTIELRPVKIGLQTRSQTEIVSGLKEGEKVLVEKPAAPTRQLHIDK